MTANIYCRLCATKCDIYINIYEDEGQKINLATKITQCLQIWVSYVYNILALLLHFHIITADSILTTQLFM